MACRDYSSLAEILSERGSGWWIDAIVCPFSSSMGANMGLAVVALAIFGPLGLALAVRTRHPAPVVVAALFMGPLIGSAVPGPAASIAIVAILFIVIAAGFGLYRVGSNV